jgi:hypothetical protein
MPSALQCSMVLSLLPNWKLGRMRPSYIRSRSQRTVVFYAHPTPELSYADKTCRCLRENLRWPWPVCQPRRHFPSCGLPSNVWRMPPLAGQGGSGLCSNHSRFDRSLALSGSTCPSQCLIKTKACILLAFRWLSKYLSTYYPGAGDVGSITESEGDFGNQYRIA